MKKNIEMLAIWAQLIFFKLLFEIKLTLFVDRRKFSKKNLNFFLIKLLY